MIYIILKIKPMLLKVPLNIFAKKQNLIYIPVFYEGPFQSWEHCLSFVGQTQLGGAYGEGIVIKKYDTIK